MSAYSDWKAGALTDDEYKSAMRRECGDDSPREELPFYTDDADDPHWRCENCGHCKEYKIFKRVICEIFVKRNYLEQESVWLCEVDHCEHMDDDYCADFEEKEND